MTTLTILVAKSLHKCRMTSIISFLLSMAMLGCVHAQTVPTPSVGQPTSKASGLTTAVLVFPPQVGPNAPQENTYLSFAVQNVLENELDLHSSLEETWANNHYQYLFSRPMNMTAWLQGGPVPASVDGLHLRYLLTGFLKTTPQNDIEVSLLLRDRGKGTQVTRTLAMDLPSLQAFRQGVLELLKEAGIPAPKAQEPGMFWKESLPRTSFVGLGQGFYEHAQALLDDSHAEDHLKARQAALDAALKEAPQSYMLLNARGWCALEHERDQAPKYFKQALSFNPAGADAADGMATGSKALNSEDYILWNLIKADIQGRYENKIAKKQAAAKYAMAQSANRGTVGLSDTVVMNNLGGIWEDLNITSEVLPYFQGSLAIYQKSGYKLGQARALNRLGRALQSLGRRAEAIEQFNQSSVFMREANDRPGLADVLGHLGSAYRAESQYDRAINCYTKELEIARALNDTERVGTTLNDLGLAYNWFCRYDKATECYTQALKIAHIRQDNAAEASALNNLGFVSASLSQWASARTYYQQALMIKRAAGDSAGEGIVLNNLGGVENALGQSNDATTHFTQARDLARNAGNRAGEGVALNNLASVQEGRRHYPEALDMYTQALAVERETKNRPLEGCTLHNLGTLYYYLKDYPRAVSYFSQALPIRREVKDRQGEAFTLNNLMWAFTRQEKPSLGIFFGKQAVNTYQQIRTEIQALGREAQQSFIGSRADTYRQLAELLIQQGRLPEAQQVLGMLKEEEYFAFVRGGDATTGISIGFKGQEQDWEIRLSDMTTTIGVQKEGLLEKMNAPGLTDADHEQITTKIAALDADLITANQKFQDAVTQIAAQADKPAQGKQISTFLNDAGAFSDTLHDLGPGTVALYTLIGAEKCHVIVVTSQTQKAEEYAVSAKELNTKIFAFRKALQNPRQDPRPLGHELYQILVAPIEKDLAGANAHMLMWSLDGALRYLPVAALYDGKRYLVERYCNEVFTPASTDRLKDTPKPSWEGLGMGVSQKQTGFDALPGVPKELHDVIHEESSAKGKGVLPGEVLLDKQFTQASMIAALESGKYPLVHIASHFAFRPGTTEDASFLLLGDGTHLSLSQLKVLPRPFRNVDLLTLSACDTASGDTGADGREVEGFGVLAQRQGAKSVVASLWPVADASTPILMQRFYQIHTEQAGISKVEALRQAQLSLLRGSELSQSVSTGRGAKIISEGAPNPSAPQFLFDPKTPYGHPFYWAPFILIGNWK